MKHAYLIIAHNDFYILEKLLLLLDDKNNDIYIHIDKKVKDFDFNYYKNLIKKSNIYFIERIDVRWASFSQIECELLLLKEATKNKYDYYHLLSGVDLPLTSQKKIHEFFQNNNGKEFVHFSYINEIPERILSRVKYYHLFVRKIRNSKIYSKIWWRLLKLEEKMKINRVKKIKKEFRYGSNWFSITHNLANYVLENEDFIKKTFKYTSCCDEIFLQTIVYNSKYFDNLYLKQDNSYKANQRYIDWTRGEPYTFKINDYDELIKSDMLFARKFSTKVDKEIVDKIYDYVRGVK